MNILVCAPTELELAPFIEHCKLNFEQLSFSKFKITSTDEVEILITGVGSVMTTHSLAKYFTLNTTKLAIQIGVAGTFEQDAPLGNVYEVKSDCFADWGAESVEENKYLDLFDLNLAKENQYPFADKKLINENPIFENVESVNAITVNTISTNTQRNIFFKEKYEAQIETMEGAAFAYSCMMGLVDFGHLRGISNYVGDRDKKNWKLRSTIQNVNQVLIQWIQMRLRSNEI